MPFYCKITSNHISPIIISPKQSLNCWMTIHYLYTKLFGFPNLWLWAYLMKLIQKRTARTMSVLDEGPIIPHSSLVSVWVFIYCWTYLRAEYASNICHRALSNQQTLYIFNKINWLSDCCLTLAKEISALSRRSRGIFDGIMSAL
jgi:hypothetical protein